MSEATEITISAVWTQLQSGSVSPVVNLFLVGSSGTIVSLGGAASGSDEVPVSLTAGSYELIVQMSTSAAGGIGGTPSGNNSGTLDFALSVAEPVPALGPLGHSSLAILLLLAGTLSISAFTPRLRAIHNI